MRSPASLLRRALAALGLAAALTLLLQPICAAYESAPQPDDGAVCCLEMQPDALIAAPSLQGEKAVAPVLAGAAVLVATWGAANPSGAVKILNHQVCPQRMSHGFSPSRSRRKLERSSPVAAASSASRATTTP